MKAYQFNREQKKVPKVNTKIELSEHQYLVREQKKF